MAQCFRSHGLCAQGPLRFFKRKCFFLLLNQDSAPRFRKRIFWNGERGFKHRIRFEHLVLECGSKAINLRNRSPEAALVKGDDIVPVSSKILDSGGRSERRLSARSSGAAVLYVLVNHYTRVDVRKHHIGKYDSKPFGLRTRSGVIGQRKFGCSSGGIMVIRWNPASVLNSFHCKVK